MLHGTPPADLLWGFKNKRLLASGISTSLFSTLRLIAETGPGVLGIDRGWCGAGGVIGGMLRGLLSCSVGFSVCLPLGALAPLAYARSLVHGTLGVSPA